MEEVFARFPRLYERRHEQAGYLSGGAADAPLGMALLTRPRLLVVDEPSLGLAPKLVGEVMQTLDALRREKGLSSSSWSKTPGPPSASWTGCTSWKGAAWSLRGAPRRPWRTRT